MSYDGSNYSSSTCKGQRLILHSGHQSLASFMLVMFCVNYLFDFLLTKFLMFIVLITKRALEPYFKTAFYMNEVFMFLIKFIRK